MKLRLHSSARTDAGLTIAELLVVIGIIAVLAALGYAHTGPAREKARQAVCLSNLRQVGMALQMYRADCSGSDVGRTPAEFGIPHNHYGGLLPYAGNAIAVFQCPSVSHQTYVSLTMDGEYSLGMTYAWNVWHDAAAPLTDWGRTVARRGPEFPLFYCKEHDRPDPDRPVSASFVHVWRLMGSVEAKFVAPRSSSWEW